MQTGKINLFRKKGTLILKIQWRVLLSYSATKTLQSKFQDFYRQKENLVFSSDFSPPCYVVDTFKLIWKMAKDRR